MCCSEWVVVVTFFSHPFYIFFWFLIYLGFFFLFFFFSFVMYKNLKYLVKTWICFSIGLIVPHLVIRYDNVSVHLLLRMVWNYFIDANCICGEFVLNDALYPVKLYFREVDCVDYQFCWLHDTSLSLEIYTIDYWLYIHCLLYDELMLQTSAVCQMSMSNVESQQCWLSYYTNLGCHKVLMWYIEWMQGSSPFRRLTMFTCFLWIISLVYSMDSTLLICI